MPSPCSSLSTLQTVTSATISRSTTTYLGSEYKQNLQNGTLLSSVPILTNSRNNCWFHCALVFLGQCLNIRTLCLELVSQESGTFDIVVAKAILATCGISNLKYIDDLFHVVKDFAGRSSRYHQLPVPDFIDF